MSVPAIISLPDPRLRQRSARVGFIDQATRDAVASMQAVTLAWERSREGEIGVALAAVQIGMLERIIVIRHEPENKQSKAFEVFINPEITKREGPIMAEPEGCLSVPDIYGLVPRHESVRLKAQDINGRPVRLRASGFLARVLQHEVDHLHGKLFIDHVKDATFYKITSDGTLKPLDQPQIDAARLLWNG